MGMGVGVGVGPVGRGGPGTPATADSSRPAGHSRPTAEATQDEKHGVQLLAACVPSPSAPLLVLLHTSSRGGGRVMGGQYGRKQSCTRRADVVPGGVEEGRAQSPGRQLLETGP